MEEKLRALVQARQTNQLRRDALRGVERRFQTAFIGALSRFEGHFGWLWGHGLAEAELSEDQLAWREVWSRCRTEVLTNGNNQLRSALAELEER